MSIRILISETDKIGDVILALPTILAVRKKYPDAFIGFLISPYTFDIVKNNPYIDKIILFNSNSFSEIKKYNFDTALMLYPCFHVAKLIYKCRIKRRIMNGFKWYQFLFNNIIYQHRSRIEKHQAVYNMELASRFLGTSVNIKEIKIWLDKNDILFANNFFKKNELTGKSVIGVHPGSGGSSLNLPSEKYSEIIDWVLSNTNSKVLLTGSKEEIVRIKNKDIVKVPGNLTLGQLCAIISKLKIFISNSTGPMHIATAFNVMTISFFSPIFVHSPKRWGPYVGKNLVLLPDVQCKEYWHCKMEKCGNFPCMSRVNLQTVYKFIKENL